MKLDIHFVDFKPTDALTRFVERHLETLRRRLDKRWPGSHVEFFLRIDGITPLGRVNRTHAKALVTLPGQRRTIPVTKDHRDMRQAIGLTTHAIEMLFQKETEKNEASRRTLGHSHRSVRNRKRSSLSA